MRDYTTIAEQSVYDLAIQQFGALNNIDKVMRQMPDLNASTDFGIDMVFENTTNNLAAKISANDMRFATGVTAYPTPTEYRTFDSTFDYTFY